QAAEERAAFAHEQAAERRRIQLRRNAIDDGAGVSIDDAVQQHDDRIAARDEMIVGEPHAEPLAVVEREEADRDDRATHREGSIELALDFGARRRMPVGVAWNDVELDRRRAAAIFVAATRAIENQARQAGARQLRRDRGLEQRSVESSVDLDDMDG